jgi:5'-nucleotidase
VAFSALVGEHFSFDRCAELAARLVRYLLEHERDPHIILNVNFPVGAFQGIRVTKLGKRIYSEGIIERLDPRGRAYYWIGAGPPSWNEEEGTDFEAVQNGFVSITPLHLDLTHHQSIARLRPLEELLAD